MSRSRYLEQCVEAMHHINAAHIYDLSLGQELGRGSSVVTHYLGEVSVDTEAQALALKVPNKGQASDASEVRLYTELSAALFMTNKAPEVIPLLPAFLGLLKVVGNDTAVAIVTEDVSRNGALAVRPASASRTNLNLLYYRFNSESQTPADIFYADAFEYSVAFTVDGEERWLDLTPPPVEPYARIRTFRETFDAIGSEITAAKDDLTVLVPANSPLALSLR